MQVTLPLQNWIEHLRCLTPVTGMVHVGAGAGQDAVRYADWGVPSAVLVEAEGSYHDKLAAVASAHPGWSAHTALLSDREEEKNFYLATNPNENGVLPPETLTSLWRNLKTKEQRQANASTLARLLTALNLQPETINWIVIDCLPALPVMRGAGQYLDGWDVIIARVVLDEAQLRATDATKAEVDVFLSGHGYRCVACEEERQPAVGRALYVRDRKTPLYARLHDLQRDVAIQAQASVQLQKTKDEQTRLAAERQTQIDQLIKARDEQARLAAECQQQVEQLTKAKEEQTQLAADRHAQLEQITKARDDQLLLLSDKKRELDRAHKLSQERAERITQLEAELAEMGLRQNYLNQEMIKAEAQISLIKDVLLVDHGL